MSEHKSAEQVMKKTERDMFNITDGEKEKIIKPMMEHFKISEQEAIVRAMMMKKFALTHHRRLGDKTNIIIDLIAEGSLIPTNTIMPYDKPVSEYLIRYDVEAEERKKNDTVLHMKFDFMGKKFRVMVTSEKFAAKKFGEVFTAKEIAEIAEEKKNGK